MFQGFKEFITKGNVIDLAVAVVIGTAFTAIVTALVDDSVFDDADERGFSPPPLRESVR